MDKVIVDKKKDDSGKICEAKRRSSNDENNSEHSSKKKIIKLDHLDASLIAINTNLIKEFFLNSFKENWLKSLVFESSNPCFKLNNEPFKICVVQNFLDNSNYIDELVREITPLDWIHKQMDLYEFFQTPDLISMPPTMPFLTSFYANLKTNVMPWMEKLTGEKLTHVSASCSMYNFGDFLLVHDDLLSDRKIAFVFYMSPWPEALEWTESMGGALEVFSANEQGQPFFPVMEKYFPRNNQFVFFKVSNKSFHQVGEVTNTNYPRLSINGWFHGPTAQDNTNLKLCMPPLEFTEPIEVDINLNDWISGNYLEQSVKKSIQNQIEDNSEASLEKFLKEDIFQLLQKELKNFDNEKWVLQGPANHQHYEKLLIDHIEGPVKDLINLFLSEDIFHLWYEYTDLDLSGRKAKNPLCNVEIIRITQQSYTLLGNSINYSNDFLDIIMFINAVDNVGIVQYLNPEDGSDEDELEEEKQDSNNSEISTGDSVLLTLEPKDNALNLVYRSTGTAKFLKYVSKNVISNNEFVYILLASYKE